MEQIAHLLRSGTFRALALTAALLSVVFLSGSVEHLNLEAGSPFPGGMGVGDRADSASQFAAGKAASLHILQGFFAAAFLVLSGLFLSRLIKLINLQRMLQLGLAAVAALILAALLPRVTPGQPSGLPQGIDAVATPRAFTYSVEPIGRPSDLLIQLAVFLAAAGLVAAILLIWRRQSSGADVQQVLLEQARSALQELHGGHELTNVVLRCYQQMSLVLQQEKGLERKTAMTVREFEIALGKHGFPRQPVNRLTSLFELARYSGELPGHKQEEEAVACLEALVEYCHENGEGSE